MASRLPTFCPHCGRVAPPGKRCDCRPRRRREATAADATRREREPWRDSYSKPGYQRARQVAIGRTSGRCASCGKECAVFDGRRWITRGMDGEVHHRVPLRDGGTDEAGNLVLLCKSCHALADAALRRAKSRRR